MFFSGLKAPCKIQSICDEVLSTYRSSHSGELLLKYEIELKHQLNGHVSSSVVSTLLATNIE